MKPLNERIRAFLAERGGPCITTSEGHALRTAFRSVESTLSSLVALARETQRRFP